MFPYLLCAAPGCPSEVLHLGELCPYHRIQRAIAAKPRRGGPACAQCLNMTAALRALLAQYLADAGEPAPGSEAERVLNAARAAIGE